MILLFGFEDDSDEWGEAAQRNQGQQCVQCQKLAVFLQNALNERPQTTPNQEHQSSQQVYEDSYVVEQSFIGPFEQDDNHEREIEQC